MFITSVLSLAATGKSLAPSVLLQIFAHTDEIPPLDFLLSRLNGPSSLNLYNRQISLFVILVSFAEPSPIAPALTLGYTANCRPPTRLHTTDDYLLNLLTILVSARISFPPSS